MSDTRVKELSKEAADLWHQIYYGSRQGGMRLTLYAILRFADDRPDRARLLQEFKKFFEENSS